MLATTSTPTPRRRAVAALSLALAATLAAGCGGGDDDADTTTTTTTTAPAEAPTSGADATGPEGDTSTTAADDPAGGDDPAALCAAAGDTADLEGREALTAALQQAWFDAELVTNLEGGETLSLLSCEGSRAEMLHVLPSGTQELVVFNVGDDGFATDVVQDVATACADADTSEAATAALAC